MSPERGHRRTSDMSALSATVRRMTSDPYEGAPEKGLTQVSSAPGSQSGAAGDTPPPAGWYPTPSGGQRYWDGEQWLELPPPPEAATPTSGATADSSAEKARRTRKLVLSAAA